MLRLILLSTLFYMLYRMIKPLLFSTNKRSSTPHVKQKHTNEDIQKKLHNKIEDADFEDIE